MEQNNILGPNYNSIICLNENKATVARFDVLFLWTFRCDFHFNITTPENILNSCEKHPLSETLSNIVVRKMCKKDILMEGDEL